MSNPLIQKLRYHITGAIERREKQAIVSDTRADITNQSDNELSLIVFNDEYLYNYRIEQCFMELINSMFIYTKDQLTTLACDIEVDLMEQEQKAGEK